MDDPTAKGREQAALAPQEIEARLSRLTALSRAYSEAEARHTREQSPHSWKHQEALGKIYEQETQWFYDRGLLPQWSKDEKRYYKANPAPTETQE